MEGLKGNLVTIIMGVTIVLLLVVMGMQFYMITKISSNGEHGGAGSVSGESKKKNEITIEDIETIKVVEKKIYTLAPDANGDAYTTRMTIGIGLNKKSIEYKEKAPLIEEKGPVINDILDSTIRTKTHDDMLRGTAFYEELKTELISRLNDKLDTDIIVAVYFDDVYSQVIQ